MALTVALAVLELHTLCWNIIGKVVEGERSAKQEVLEPWNRRWLRRSRRSEVYLSTGGFSSGFLDDCDREWPSHRPE